MAKNFICFTSSDLAQACYKERSSDQPQQAPPRVVLIQRPVHAKKNPPQADKHNHRQQNRPQAQTRPVPDIVEERAQKEVDKDSGHEPVSKYIRTGESASGIS